MAARVTPAENEPGKLAAAAAGGEGEAAVVAVVEMLKRWLV